MDTPTRSALPLAEYDEGVHSPLQRSPRPSKDGRSPASALTEWLAAVDSETPRRRSMLVDLGTPHRDAEEPSILASPASVQDRTVLLQALEHTERQLAERNREVRMAAEIGRSLLEENQLQASRLQTMQMTHAELAAQCAASKQALAHREALAARLQSEKQELSLQLSQSRDETARAREELLRVQTSLMQAEAQTQHAVEAATQSAERAQLLDQRVAELTGTERQLHALSKSCDELRDANEALQAEVTRLQAGAARAGQAEVALRRELAEAQQQLGEAVKSLSEESDVRCAAQEEVEELRARLSQLSSDHEGAQQLHEELMAAKAQARGTAARVEQLDAGLAALRAQVAALQEERDEMRAALDDARNTAAALQAASAQLTPLGADDDDDEEDAEDEAGADSARNLSAALVTHSSSSSSSSSRSSSDGEHDIALVPAAKATAPGPSQGMLSPSLPAHARSPLPGRPPQHPSLPPFATPLSAISSAASSTRRTSARRVRSRGALARGASKGSLFAELEKQLQEEVAQARARAQATVSSDAAASLATPAVAAASSSVATASAAVPATPTAVVGSSPQRAASDTGDASLLSLPSCAATDGTHSPRELPSQSRSRSGSADVLTEFFFLTVMAVKMGIYSQDKRCSISSEELFARAQSEGVPFHMYHNWVVRVLEAEGAGGCLSSRSSDSGSEQRSRSWSLTGPRMRLSVTHGT